MITTLNDNINEDRWMTYVGNGGEWRIRIPKGFKLITLLPHDLVEGYDFIGLDKNNLFEGESIEHSKESLVNHSNFGYKRYLIERVYE